MRKECLSFLESAFTTLHDGSNRGLLYYLTSTYEHGLALRILPLTLRIPQYLRIHEEGNNIIIPAPFELWLDVALLWLERLIVHLSQEPRLNRNAVHHVPDNKLRIRVIFHVPADVVRQGGLSLPEHLPWDHAVDERIKVSGQRRLVLRRREPDRISISIEDR